MDTLSRPRSSRRWILQRGALLTLAALPLCGASVRAQDAPAAPAAAPAADGIRLRSRWTPGEMLSYDMRLEGTMNMQASPNAAGNPLAGIPLEVELKMSGASALEALSVDDMGTARVVPRLNALRMQATTFGQRADLTLEDGRFGFALNGQQMGRGARNERNATFLSNPPFALEISDRGRITGAVARDDKGNAQAPGAPVPAAPAPAAPAPADPAKPQAAAPGLDWAKLAQSMFWRAIPTLWPATPVKNGDAWASDVSVPLPDAADPKVLTPKQLGHFDFVMHGLEDVAGKRAARVSIKGGLELDGKTSRAIAEAAKQEGAQVAPGAARQVEGARQAADAKRKDEFDTQLGKAAQKIEGDLWVDPDNGHVVRAELTLDTQASGTEVPRPGVTPKAKPGDSFFDFTGTLQMQLTNRALKPAA